jgi:diamine N-acetyltransferase
MPDASEIRLSCHPGNTGAERLYRSLGFSPTGEFKDDEMILALSDGFAFQEGGRLGMEAGGADAG